MDTKRIKDLRIDHDLSQQNVADILKISRQYYTRYECGQVEIPIRHLISLAKYYGVSLDYLVGIQDESKSVYGGSTAIGTDVQFAQEIKRLYKKYYERNGK